MQPTETTLHWETTKFTLALRGTNLHLLVFGQSINDCDDKVFGKGKVGRADTL